ncbi:MAG: hypothetical protein ABI844_14455 [Saprospiraceae bacterium]
MLKQFIISIGSLKVSKDFMLKYRLWEGWESMRWIHISFVFAAIFFGFKMLGIIGSAFSNLGNLISGDFENIKLGMTGGAFVSDWSFVKSDSYKYLFLFFTMSIVYHIGGRAMEILYNIPYRPNFKFFVKSQIRTAIVVMVCFILEQVFSGISSMALGLIGFKWLQPASDFIIQSFLFGAILLDGLHEVRGWKVNHGIKHSFKFYSGIALFYGAIGLILSYIPILGLILVSTILSVGILIAIKRIEALSY